MFVGQHIVYLDLQKTGSSHIRKVLGELPQEKGTKHPEHITFSQLPDGATSDWEEKIKLGSIRNPWAWYVSLWAYGCMGMGSIRKQLCSFDWNYFYHKNRTLSYWQVPRRKWKETYKDVQAKALFKKWLEMLFSRQRKMDLIEYARSPISSLAGLYTYRYLRLYSKNFHHHFENINTWDSLQKWDENHNMIDFMIRQEHLNKDILTFLSQYNIPLPNNIDQLTREKTNTSEHLHFSHYYDDESFLWVAEQEKFIIKKHQYSQMSYQNGKIISE